MDHLMTVATRVFLQEGYSLASMDKVAMEAGVSTRTIYQRFRNKAALLISVILRLVQRDMDNLVDAAVLSCADVKTGLFLIAVALNERASNPEAFALFRIVAAEAPRFPDLALTVRRITKDRIDRRIETYLCEQVARGTLQISDCAEAAALFAQMVLAQLHERLLFGVAGEPSTPPVREHLQRVVDIFLHGTTARDLPAAQGAG